jgi:hypothetical protein
VLVEHGVGGGLLLLAAQGLNLSPQLRKLVAVVLLLVGQLALVSAQLGIVAASDGVCFTRLGLQLVLEVLGLSSLTGLFLLELYSFINITR